MTLPKILTSLLLFITGILFGYANVLPDSTGAASPVVVPDATKEAITQRLLEQFRIPIERRNTDPIVPDLSVTDSVQYHRNKAQEYAEDVQRRNAFIGKISDLASMQLPVGIEEKLGGLGYTIIITKIAAKPDNTSLVEAYCMLELPSSGDKIAFRGVNIPFSNEGGLSGNGRLELVGSYPKRWNDQVLFTLLGQGGTFVDFDCHGFKSLSVEIEAEFSRDLIIPEDERTGLLPAPARVKSRFRAEAASLNDLLFEVNLPSFQMNGLKDFTFRAESAYFDWSDRTNPGSLQFPAGYTSPFIAGNKPELWQGFYLQRLSVKMPASFANRNSANRIALSAENMILDEQGFSGKIAVENVLPEGDMSGWRYSIDRIGVEFVINEVRAFELAGKITVPHLRAKDNSPARFGFRAQLSSSGDYLFVVSIEKEMGLPFLLAELNLKPGSTVTVQSRDGKLYPSALLNGSLSIKGTGSGPKPVFNNIGFEGLLISSEAPHFDVRAIGFGNEQQSVSDYPVVISNIGMRKGNANRFGLNFDLNVNLTGSAENEGFRGRASLTLWGKKDTEVVRNAEGQATGGTESKWNFEKIELSGIAIDISKPNAYEFKGNIQFFEGDAVYGNGFRGSLQGSLSKFGGLQVTALFGRTPDYRYWYADALVVLRTGVPLIPGVLFATGFGGGLYFNMKQTGRSPGSRIGETRSGIYYVPEQHSIGIKAVMNIGAARPEAMNGDVGFELAMNSHGGINSVSMNGNANFMSLAGMAEDKLKELTAASAVGGLVQKLSGLQKGQIFGTINLVFDNANDLFHGNMEVYVNVAGGLIRGVSHGNKAGWAVLHFEKTDWYVHIGTPTQPIGLELLRLFRCTSYFMLGKNLPGSPPPPPQVSEILNGVNFDSMRDFNALKSGTGYAFGMHFSVDTGDLRFLMFYGRFSAGAGFDIMLKNYGTQYRCEGGSPPLGINGWYANGQAYAFVQGKIGIRVNLTFYKGDFDILSIGAAAVLQAKGPNPFWMKGTVGGYYRILGGLVKGRCQFEVTVGTDCKPVGEQNLLQAMKMIGEVKPAHGSTEVDVFTPPQAAFNIPVGEVFDITDLENKRHIFRAALEQFEVMDGTEKLAGGLQWNESRDVVIFDKHDILPGQKELKATVKLRFEEEKNGSWESVVFDGRPVEEVVAVTFRTGPEPDHIPDHNVAVSYPLAGQTNFYQREYDQGFIQLKDGQPKLFRPGEQWIQKIRMTQALGGGYAESDLSYNEREKRVNFALPPNLALASVYRFEILNLPRQNTAIDANVTLVNTELLSASEASKATLTTKKLEGDLTRLEAKTIFNASFRTSKYNTFSEKMSRTSAGKSLRVDIDPALNVFKLVSYIGGDEIFEKAEIEGSGNRLPLIYLEANLQGNTWYDQHVYPLLYEGYPLVDRIRLTRRDPFVLGLPPARDIHFANFNQPAVALNEQSVFVPPSFSNEYIVYNLGASVFGDYRDLQLQAANYYVSDPSLYPERLMKLIRGFNPHIRQGTYKVRLTYKIPLINRSCSTHEWGMWNDIPDN